MSDSLNVSIVRRFYDSMGDIDVLRQIMASDIIWDVTEGSRYGGVYEGIEDILNNFFVPFLNDIDEFIVDSSEYFESDDHVIVLGNYLGRVKRGKRFISRFVHIWTVRDGWLVKLQQTADTLQIERAHADYAIR
ncbi:nuclear transport factor 2 family protein [Photorhabdus bodei]|uniref:nuclear transport factor 2 family protein n=1 Tax=Photorhabdus bodei TaxID=2029681 RepID=UPI001E4A9FE8|nr:nuclear transport factor 2 family protein [Photorhabdus bodei]MCC8466218.1 nuclear transport factor 2 family protein [Photorhabdus bodei]